jgi:hypothetical protein
VVDLRSRSLRLPLNRAAKVDSDRYIVVERQGSTDRAHSLESAAATPLRSFATRELAELYAADEVQHGRSVVVIDREQEDTVAPNRRLLGLQDSLPPGMKFREPRGAGRPVKRSARQAAHRRRR